jgi:hypothetical protein
MRVMVVVVVPDQHAKVAYATPVTESIRKIGWKKSDFCIAFQPSATEAL